MNGLKLGEWFDVICPQQVDANKPQPCAGVKYFHRHGSGCVFGFVASWHVTLFGGPVTWFALEII